MQAEGDGMLALRSALTEIGAERQHWAGVPMPLDGLSITIEPSFPRAQALMAVGRREVLDDDDPDIKIRNRFWSWHLRLDVIVYEKGGRATYAPMGLPNHATELLNTLMASDAWGLRQEMAAQALLESLIGPRKFRQYVLTGSFLERSKRSGVYYLFRRLRPTLALSSATDEMRMLAALCLHPIGYYKTSWGGAMCPTDDVIAHLMLMRGDEAMFWRRANQHAPHRHEAGI